MTKKTLQERDAEVQNALKKAKALRELAAHEQTWVDYLDQYRTAAKAAIDEAEAARQAFEQWEKENPNLAEALKNKLQKDLGQQGSQVG